MNRHLKQVKILVLEDSIPDFELLATAVRTMRFMPELRRVESKNAFLDALKEWSPDIIISDYTVPSYNGRSALIDTQRLRPDIPFLFFSGTIGEELAIEALQLGASDYVLKDKPKRLISAIQRAISQAEQKRLQKETDERIRDQAHLLDLATDAIMVRDLDDQIQYANQSAARVYGFSLPELVGKNVKELLSKDFFQKFDEAKSAALQTGHWEGELEQITASKQKILVNSRWTLVRNEKNECRLLVINTDITAKKALEKQFLRAQRLESVGTLASGIAHDLNNILAPILMASELLRGEALPPHATGMLNTIHRSAQRGADIVKQVLTFVRGTDGKRVPLLLNYLINEVGSVVRETFPRNIKFRSSHQNGLWMVHGDATQLHQVLMNLCVNARDAMPSGGNLSISATNAPTPSGPCVLLKVEDTGLGMPPEVVEKIFDPFFTTKEPGKGTGLGLSTVMGIVKSHGGTIRVESNPGGGASFQILLPADPKGVEGDVTSQLRATNRGRGQLIMVVDDEAAIRQVISQVLVKNGYEVLTASDGSTAIIQFTEKKPEIKLIITDLMMPGMDGASLMKVMTAIKPDIKFIITSGLTENIHVPEGTPVLEKPVSAGVLLQTVEEALKPRPTRH